MTGGVFRRERLIRFSDCDPAGIVFYPQYFVMFNGLVEDWFNEELRIGYADLITRRRVGLPMVHLETDFVAPGHIGEHVTLSLAVEKLSSRSITLAMSCSATAEGTRKVSATQVLVSTSLDTHQAIALPDDLRTRIQSFMNPGQPA